MAKQTGVAIIDAAAASTPVERLTEKLKSQFPDLVLIVAGRLDDQSALAAQITNGTVYRFLHKPVSEQRVKLFVDAAWRRHGEELSGVADPMGTTGVLPDERAPLPRNALLFAGAVLAALVAAGGWFMTRKPSAIPDSTSHVAVTPAARDEQFETLLARADRAFVAGALVAPAGANAADLYKQAFHRDSSDPRAAAGIEKVIDKLLSAAEAQLAAQHLEEAQKLTEQARAVKPDHVRVAFLAAQIGKERERSVLTHARQAASGGNLEEAVAVPNGAAPEDKPSTLAAEAPQEPEQKKLDDRVNVDVAADSSVSQAHDAGNDEASTNAVESDMTAALDDTKRSAEVVNAGNLVLAHYAPPTFPVTARERGVSGWVDVQFVVKSDGLVSDVIITGAEPVGIFEQAAVDAVKKWRYNPAQRDGHAIDQRARLRMKFALDK